jgi:hypothetical protein
MGIGLGHSPEVHHDIRSWTEQFGWEVEEIAPGLAHAFGQVGFVFAAVEDRHLVAEFMEAPDGVWTGKTGAAKD